MGDKCRMEINDDGAYRCSKCGEIWKFTHDGPLENSWNYCPCCGSVIDMQNIEDNVLYVVLYVLSTMCDKVEEMCDQRPNSCTDCPMADSEGCYLNHIDDMLDGIGSTLKRLGIEVSR